MKLQCKVEIVNRVNSSSNARPSAKHNCSTLALGKEPKNDKEYFILHFSKTNKTGTKYRVKFIKQVFVKCINEGKATIRFSEPELDLCINSEPIQLKCFMKLLKSCLMGEATASQLSSVGTVVPAKGMVAPTRLVVKDRSELPKGGLPRSLEQLQMSGLKLCNFRREILMLKKLKVLDLSNNEMVKIPPEFGKMSTIVELNLANNQLGKKMDNWNWLLGSNINTTLKLLDLSENHLTSLPKPLWKLSQLVTLRLDNNQLKKIPPSVGRITTLRYLSVSDNWLQSLPCSVIHCHLEHLDISGNRFHIPIDEDLGHSKSNMWEICVGDLQQIAAKVILKNKVFYDNKILPWMLADFLDDSSLCFCGAPVVNSTLYLYKEFAFNSYVRTLVFESNHTSLVNLECYFCSPRCLVR